MDSSLFKDIRDNHQGKRTSLVTENVKYLAIMFFNSAPFESLDVVNRTYTHEQIFQIFSRATFNEQRKWHINKVSPNFRSTVLCKIVNCLQIVKELGIQSFSFMHFLVFEINADIYGWFPIWTNFCCNTSNFSTNSLTGDF